MKAQAFLATTLLIVLLLSPIKSWADVALCGRIYKGVGEIPSLPPGNPYFILKGLTREPGANDPSGYPDPLPFYPQYSELHDYIVKSIGQTACIIGNFDETGNLVVSDILTPAQLAH